MRYLLIINKGKIHLYAILKFEFYDGYAGCIILFMKYETCAGHMYNHAQVTCNLLTNVTCRSREAYAQASSHDRYLKFSCHVLLGRY